MRCPFLKRARPVKEPSERETLAEFYGRSRRKAAKSLSPSEMGPENGASLAWTVPCPLNRVLSRETGGNFCFLRQLYLRPAVTCVRVSSLVSKFASLSCRLSHRSGSLSTLSTDGWGRNSPPRPSGFRQNSADFRTRKLQTKIPAWAMPGDGASGGQAVGVAVGTLPKKPFRCVFDSFGNGVLSGPAWFDVGQRGAAPLRQTVPGPESTPSLSIKAHTV